MDALVGCVGGGVDGDLIPVEALDGIGIVDGPDCFLGFVDEDRLLAALDTLLGAGSAGASVLCTAHGVRDPAGDCGIGGAG